MPSPLCVLLFGNDSHLLKSRCLVLESAGCKVYMETHLAALTQILTDHHIDLLILCHTLTVEECERAKAAVETFSPEVRVLVLAAADFAECAESGDRVVSTGGGPRAMLQTVNEMAKVPSEPRPNGSGASA